MPKVNTDHLVNYDNTDQFVIDYIDHSINSDNNTGHRR